MIYKQILIAITFVITFIFTGCAKTSGSESSSVKDNRLNKVYETSYPDGISVTFGHELLRKDLRISDARLVSGKYKKQVQFTINNTSKENYTALVIAEWSNKRGISISSYPIKKRIRLSGGASKRIVLNAPNTRAKDVAIEIECTSEKCN